MVRSIINPSVLLFAILAFGIAPHSTPAAPLTGARSDQELILDLMGRCDRAAQKKDWKTVSECTTEDWVRDGVMQAELATSLIYVFASIELDGKNAPDPATVKRKAAATAMLEYAAGKRSARFDAAAYRSRVEATADKSVTPGKRRELLLALSRECYSTADVRALSVRFTDYLLSEATRIDDPPVHELIRLRVAGDRATGHFAVRGKVNTYEFRCVDGSWRIDEGPREESLLERGLSTPPLGTEDGAR